jgi:hypothetical protein
MWQPRFVSLSMAVLPLISRPCHADDDHEALVLENAVDGDALRITPEEHLAHVAVWFVLPVGRCVPRGHLHEPN